MLSRSCALLVVLPILGLGCGLEEPPALSRFDSGPEIERAPPDTGPDEPPAPAAPADAGLPMDAGLPTQDASPRPDIDAGEILDSGEQDAGAQTLGQRCFAVIDRPGERSPDYDQFGPQVGSHCYGTNHQDIDGIERVVFLGDSVTVGTPPTEHVEYYRSLLADRLSQRFGLEPPSDLWKRASLINGTALVQESGDFASCAKWGARTDDLNKDNTQILDCFPEGERQKRTLVIMTVGGNDIAAITKRGAEGAPLSETRAMTEAFVADLRNAVAWFREDPTRFPNGVFLIFSNNFEFTDGTGDVESCPAASLAGFAEPWENPRDLEELVLWATEQYMDIAVANQVDMLFLLEHFCGHGFRSDDPTARCYRGPGTERWFDVSCIHPNPLGHQAIAEMVMGIVEE